jgi:hypothetical protein
MRAFLIATVCLSAFLAEARTGRLRHMTASTQRLLGYMFVQDDQTHLRAMTALHRVLMDVT